MVFIEWMLFNDKKKNFKIYERHLFDLIYTRKLWNLLKVSSSTMREGT
jgi:hypothetical protein